MATALRYRLFRRPKLPAELKAAVAGATPLVCVEGVSVKCSGRSIRMPGLRSSRSVRLLAGSVVLLPDRVLAAIGAYVVLDARFAAAGTEGQAVTFAADGVHLTIDVTSVFEAGSGTVELVFRAPLEPSVLAQVPTAPVAVAVTVADTVPVMLRQWV